MVRDFNINIVQLPHGESNVSHYTSTDATHYFDCSIPKYTLAEDDMTESAAYQLIHDEMNLDGNPTLNLALFVTTWMNDGANKLIAENIRKNFLDSFILSKISNSLIKKALAK